MPLPPVLKLSSIVLIGRSHGPFHSSPIVLGNVVHHLVAVIRHLPDGGHLVAVLVVAVGLLEPAVLVPLLLAGDEVDVVVVFLRRERGFVWLEGTKVSKFFFLFLCRPPPPSTAPSLFDPNF